MNKENVLRIANTVFEDINNVSKDIYKGELKINSKKPAGIYFLDMNGDFNSDNFTDYQENLLADEYYKHPGGLQWNYYLLLLQDRMDQKLKEKIERDDKYARKYVFTEKQFEDFFKLESSSAQLSGNIVLEWKKLLNSVGLQVVYSKTKYTEGLEDFLNNRNKTYLPETRSLKQPKPETIKFINKIKLNPAYREFPITRTFNFGKVNLVKGINGVGKTSLFEAIELITCGRTFRNPDIKEKDVCIEAVFNDDFKIAESCTPSQSEKYRSRDLLWYNNEYSRDNYTYTSFNRFNFFNTDAANNLVTSNDEKNVKEALSNLILGPEYSYITERIIGFYTRIRPEYNRLSEASKDAEQIISQSNKTIDRLKHSDVGRAMREVVLKNIHDLQFHIQNFNLENDTVQIEALYNQLKVFLEVITKDSSISVRSYLDITAVKKMLSEKQATFNEVRITLENIDSEIREKQQEESSYFEKSKLLASTFKYFSEPKAFDIPGFGKRMAENEQAIKTIEYVKKEIGTLNVLNYSLPSTAKEAIQKNNDRLIEARAALLDIETQINNLLKQFDKIGQLVNQIKILGKEYIAEDTDAHICPLCQTDFKRIELIERVTATISSHNNSGKEIEELSQRQSILKNEIEIFTNNNHDLNLINTSYESASAGNPAAKTLAEIIQFINSLLADENSRIQQKTEFIAFNEWMNVNAVSESEFAYLQVKFSEIFDNTLEFSFAHKSDFENLLTQTNKSIDTIRIEIEKLISQKIIKVTELKSKLSLPPEKDYELLQIGSMLDAEQNNLNIYDDSFRKIRDIIKVGDDVLISDINENLSLLSKNINTLKEGIQNQFELKNAEKEKEKAAIFLAANKENSERIKKSFDILQQLLENNGTSQLDSFFSQNLIEINDIFHTIHAPREFKEFIFKDNQLLLITEDGVLRKISEISTGQRAALALSIFISLNRKLKNGPNIILFDDPISHIDDLNALSFLDFLRFFVLKEGKQIFFATANSRLADLVEKKFEFLEEDFKKWELKR